MNKFKKEFLKSISLTILSTFFCLIGAEILMRFKNYQFLNYDVEMSRYSNLLKIKSSNKIMDFEHRKNSSATLQDINIRINNYGLRGSSVKDRSKVNRRIIFLGGSVTLGWGVDEDKTVTSVLEKMLIENGESVEVLNAGIGNYNSERYVTRFFENLTHLEPSDIVVNYFLRDAEKLLPAKSNFFLRNSQLALTLWIASNRISNYRKGTNVNDHYKKIYNDEQGLTIMKKSLRKLADYSKINGINIYMLMTPDISNISNYKLDFIHDYMKDIAEANDYIFVDSLNNLKIYDEKQLFAMPGDPHPNDIGHRVMAESLYPIIAK